MFNTTARTTLAGLLAALAALAVSGCDSQAAIHSLATATVAWSELPKAIWPPPQKPLDETPITPVETAGAPRPEAAQQR